VKRLHARSVINELVAELHCRNHEKITDSATHQKIVQIVLANVDGEPVGRASSKPASLDLPSPLKRLGEDARKLHQGRQFTAARLPTRPNRRTQPIQLINNWATVH
jgi:hypothetical protein